MRSSLRPILVFALVSALACGTDSLKPEPIVDDETLYWTLDLNHHGVLLGSTAPYDTLQLVAAPRNFQGDLLANLPASQYISRDPTKVAVTSGGMLVAVSPTSQPVWVVATLTSKNLKYSDSALVKVVTVDPVPVLESFSVHPIPPDSAKLAMRTFELGRLSAVPLDTLHPRAMDPNGVLLESLPGIGSIPVYFRSSDSTTAKIHPVTGEVTGMQQGTTTLAASTTVFGVVKADQLSYRIGLPVAAYVRVVDSALGGLQLGSFLEPEFRVGVGASVVWIAENIRISMLVAMDPFFGGGFLPPGFPWTTYKNFDVTFDAHDLPNVIASNQAISTRVAGGNTGNRCVPPSSPGGLSYDANLTDCQGAGNVMLGGGPYVTGGPTYNPGVYGVAVRAFSAPGTYEYRSTLYGTRGRIIVVDDQ